MPDTTPLEPRVSIVTLLVEDIRRAHRFYADGLGFPTAAKPEDEWIAFRLSGLCLCLYPYDQMGRENLSRRRDRQTALDRSLLPGITLAYNTRERHQVEQVLEQAERAGGTIEKRPEETFWGGYSGYFADPDGHLWEVAWAASWKFNPDGSLVV